MGVVGRSLSGVVRGSILTERLWYMDHTTIRLVLYRPKTRGHTRVSGCDESRRVWTRLGVKSPAMSTIQHARPVWMHSFCAPRHSAPTWDYVGQSKSQMRLAIARGISLCASGGCAARACSRAARLEASEKCNPWVCAIQMPGGEPLSLTRGRACPVMVCHGAHESLEAGLGVRQGRPRSARMHAHAHAHAHAHWVCTCVHGCALGVHGGVGVWAWA